MPWECRLPLLGFRTAGQLGEHGRDAVGQVLSGDDRVDGCQLVDLDAVEGNDQFLHFSERDLVCSGSGPAPLAGCVFRVPCSVFRVPCSVVRGS